MAFDRAEAGAIAQQRLDDLRALSFRQLCDLRPQREERVGRSGMIYQIAHQTLWDDPKDRHLRVMVLVDDGGWTAYSPLSVDFIIAPDGTYIDEGKL